MLPPQYCNSLFISACLLLPLIFNVTHAADMKVPRANENKWSRLLSASDLVAATAHSPIPIAIQVRGQNNKCSAPARLPSP